MSLCSSIPPFSSGSCLYSHTYVEYLYFGYISLFVLNEWWMISSCNTQSHNIVSYPISCILSCLWLILLWCICIWLLLWNFGAQLASNASPSPHPIFFFHLNPQPLLALPVSQPYNPYLLVFLPVIIEKWWLSNFIFHIFYQSSIASFLEHAEVFHALGLCSLLVDLLVVSLACCLY